MNVTFKGIMTAEWTVSNEGILYKGTLYKFEQMSSATVISVPKSGSTNGVVLVNLKGKNQGLTLAFPLKQKQEALNAIEFIQSNCGKSETKATNEVKNEIKGNNSETKSTNKVKNEKEIKRNNSRMVTEKERTLLLIEIRECKGEYITLAKKYGKKQELEALYNKWDKMYTTGFLAKFNYVKALDEKNAAHRAMKVDPFIVGGAAEALGGVGVGVYSAVQAEQHNKEISENRFRTTVAASTAEVNNKIAEEKLWAACESILALLETMPESKMIREDFLSKLYELADGLAKERKIEEAIQKFDLLNGYRDSNQRIEDIKSEQSRKRQIKIVIVSFFLALIVALFSGVLAIDFGGGMFIFFCGFIISFIYLQFKMK